MKEIKKKKTELQVEKSYQYVINLTSIHIWKKIYISKTIIISGRKKKYKNLTNLNSDTVENIINLIHPRVVVKLFKWHKY